MYKSGMEWGIEILSLKRIVPFLRTWNGPEDQSPAYSYNE